MRSKKGFIRELYFQEKDSPTLKIAHKVNFKTISPNSMERQNVQLALNVFHETTIAALKRNAETRETAEFCQIIQRWWNIVNVKTTTKCTTKRDEWSAAFRQQDDFRIQFLRNFISWLHTWNHTGNTEGTFTFDAYQAAVLTTTTLLDIISLRATCSRRKVCFDGKISDRRLRSPFSAVSVNCWT